MEHGWEQRKWDAPYNDSRSMMPPMEPPPQFDFNRFSIPRANPDYQQFHSEFRSPMADCDYGDSAEPQRKKRIPYQGPAPHRNPAPAPLGLTGPWQDAPIRPQTFPRRGRGGSRHGPDNMRPKFPGNSSQQPIKDFPKNKKASPYNMTVNPTGKVDVAAAKQKLLESVLNNTAMALPKELLDKFSPLKCDLCGAKMNSTSMAKLHYSGKIHEKKVRQYMNNLGGDNASVACAPKKPKLEAENLSATPMLITANLQLEAGSVSETVAESQKMECLSCNVSFTSTSQASQHFMSKNHARKLLGLDPMNAKYYNMETCEWQAKPVPSLPEDRSGRFGIGIEFQKPPDVPVITKPPEINKSLKVFCDVCDCYTTSQEQMQIHLKGSRHQKKWQAKLKAQSNLPKGIFLEEPTPVPAPENILSSVKESQEKSAKKVDFSPDMSNFRTPSGQYYCSVCNLSVNSESQFKTHSESKKHKSKLACVKPSINEAPPKVSNSETFQSKVKCKESESPCDNLSVGLITPCTEFFLQTTG